MRGLIPELTVGFCGEEYRPHPGGTFFVGREADLSLDDDNHFLHRRFLCLYRAEELWWLENVGTQLSATIADVAGAFQAWLAPGARLPLVFHEMSVWFTAGPTTYEFDLSISEVHFERIPVTQAEDGHTTLGPVAFNFEQKMLLVALCEDLLRRRESGPGAVPKSAAVADRLGWPITKFNRKLDVVCEKLSEAGVRGLRGGVAGAASSRKARLVEYAMAARIVTVDDLALLQAR